MTIAQKRWSEVKRLAGMKAENPTGDDVREAARCMNSFYRLCGLAERNLYLSNDERSANSRYTKASENREERWFKRLKGDFSTKYGLDLLYNGYLPRIGVILPGGGFSEKISLYFYD